MQEESRAASTHLNNLWGNLLDSEANPEEIRDKRGRDQVLMAWSKIQNPAIPEPIPP